MGTQGPGRKRIANRERLSAEDDALNLIAREAEARLAAKRAARAEAREIRMKELERQQKEIYQVQKKYYGLDTKFGDIEQWMEDSEKYSRRFRRHTSASDEDDWTSVGSRSSVRTDYNSIGASGGVTEKSRKKKKKLKAANGFDELSCGPGPSKQSSRGSYYSDLPLYGTGLGSKSHSASQNGTRVSAYDGSGSRRYSTSSSHATSEHNCFLGSGSRTSSRASSARASPVVEERLEKDFAEKGSRAASSLSAATLASLGGTLSRRGSGETTTSMDTEGSIREIKEIFELKDQIQDVEGKYMEGLKELKDSLAEVEEKYKKAMVSNAQLDNEKTNLMYQVDTLRESLLELEEQLAETHRMHEEKTKELDRQKHAYSILQHQFETMKETLKEREEMLTALERQKEYSDAIRIDRDELRNEVAMLKERLKAYGMLTNGEAEPVRKEGNAHTQAAETGPQAAAQLQSSSDGPLGESHELQMRSEILETVGQRGVLQNTGFDEQMEETGNREMLMDNVQEKDITEECEELTESEMPAVTVRDNGDTDQIERTAANLDDGEQSACDTRNLGGKGVSEGINSALGFEKGKQSCGSREENESDLGVNGKHMQEDINQNLDHDEGRPGDIGESSFHGGIREEKHPEVGYELDVVHDNSVGTGADNRAIMEETRKVVQQVVENAIEILQQHTCRYELQEATRDKEVVTQLGGGLVQMTGDNLTGKQEKPAESVHVEEKEKDRLVIKEVGTEQVYTELHSTAQESEICLGNFHNDVARESREIGQVSTIAPDRNGQSGSGGEDMDSMDSPVQDGAENGERNDQGASERPMDNASTASIELEEEVEKMAVKADIGTSSLKRTALQEVDVGEEVACHLKGAKGSIVENEVKPFIASGEDPDWRDEVTVTGRVEGCLQVGEVKELGKEKLPDEVESDPVAEQGDGASQVVQQGGVEGKLEHGYFQEMTPTVGENTTVIEVERQAIEIEGDIKGYGEDEVRGNEEDEEKVKDPDTGEARNNGENEGIGDIKAPGDEREVKGLNTDEGKSNEGDKNKESDHGQGESKVKNSRTYEDEIKDSIWDKVKGQGEKEGKTNDNEGQSEIEGHEEDKVVVQVPGEVNSELKGKGDETEAQGSSVSEFKGSEELEGEVKDPREEEDEVKGLREEEGEIKGLREEEDKVKGPREEEEDEVKGTKEENEVKGPREEEGEIKGPMEEEDEDKDPREEVGDEVKGTREEEGEAKGFREEKGEVKDPPEEEDEVKNPREEEGEVKGPREEEGEVKGLREEEDEVKGPREEEEEAKGPREWEMDEVKGPREGEGEIKDPMEEEDEDKDPREEVGDEVKGTREEEGEAKGLREEEGEIKGLREEEDKVKGPREEEEDEVKGTKEENEVKGPREEEGGIKGLREEEDEVKGPREEEEDEVKGPREWEMDEVKGPREGEGEIKGPMEEEDEDKDPREEVGDEVKGPREEEGEVKGLREEEDEVKGPREEEEGAKGPREWEVDEVKGPREGEGEIKDPLEEEDEDKDPREEVGDEVKGTREEEGEAKCFREEKGEVKDPPEEEDEVKDHRVEEDEVKGPREEEEEEAKGLREEEGEVNFEPESKKLLCTNIQGIVQEMGKEVTLAEKSKETVFPDLQTIETEKEEVEERAGAEETECDLSGQASAVVQDSGEMNRVQSKSIEETNEDTPENNNENIHKVIDNEGEQEPPTKEEAGITEEATAQESLSVRNGEEMRQVPETSSSNEEFGRNAQISEGVVSDLAESDTSEIYELNKESEELAQESLQQGPVKSGAALVDVIDHGMEMQDGKKEDPVKEEGNVSGISNGPQHKTQNCKTGKERADDAPASWTGVEEQVLRGDDEDTEGGGRFEWDEEMSKILGDETQDTREASEGKGEEDAGSETEPRPIVSAEPSEHVKPNRDNSGAGVLTHHGQEEACDDPGEKRDEQGGASDREANECTNSSDQQSNHSQGQLQDWGQRDKPDTSMQQGSTGDADEEMVQRAAMAEVGKDGKRKSKSKDDCCLSFVYNAFCLLPFSPDFRVKKFIDEKEALLEQIKKLKAQLDERSKSGKAEKAATSDAILENGTDVQVIEVQRDANRQISEYKFKLTKTEQEITALEQNIIRLESQVLRYKTAAENAEKVEDELKAEKRKLQREVRSALDKIEELEMSNSHLSKRLEKMKANRSALLSQQ
ncbi:trichohyalin-like [Carcharodon carcharias]|uniref:trichohyalin-like n=1 Tax=Carcharodon carcharias TaxID=13397 RepID=UPI001B7EDD59|nr:trichohyalin-like [Carcharodon carcharias]